MKFLIFIMMFLIIGSLIIINNNDLNIYEKNDFKEFSDGYIHWLGNFYINIKTTTGNAIKLNWFPE